MGLDMYLKGVKHTYESSFWGGEKVKLDYPSELKAFADDIFEHNFQSISKEEQYQIGYWRKFWGLHNYIVNHFAYGEDNCQPIELYSSNIEKILSDLKFAKGNRDRIERIFKDNYFDNKDDEYWEWIDSNIEYSIELFEKCLDYLKATEYKGDLDAPEWQVVYQASW